MKGKHHKPLLRLKPSRIEGVGVFTDNFISKGDIVDIGDSDDCSFIPLGQEKSKKLTKLFCIRTKNGWWCPLSFTRLSIGWYLNHSDKPNLQENDDWDYYALRDIKPGEELTIDYRRLDTMDNLPEK